MMDALMDPTAVLHDQRVWHRIQPVADSLLNRGAGSRPDRLVIREFSTDETLYRACALSPDRLVGLAGALLVAVRRKGRGPSTSELRHRFGLTEREAEVARLLAHRRTNREIARHLCFSEYTARRHTERVLSKLGIHSRTDVESILLDGLDHG